MPRKKLAQEIPTNDSVAPDAPSNPSTPDLEVHEIAEEAKVLAQSAINPLTPEERERRCNNMLNTSSARHKRQNRVSKAAYLNGFQGDPNAGFVQREIALAIIDFHKSPEEREAEFQAILRS